MEAIIYIAQTHGEAGGCGGGHHSPTKAEAIEVARVVSESEHATVEVERVRCRGGGLRALLCAVGNHEGYASDTETVAVFVNGRRQS